MASIFGSIYAIIKAIPVVNSWVQMFFEFYYTQKVKEIERYHENKSTKVAAIVAQITKAKTHEERRVLMSVLSDLEQL